MYSEPPPKVPYIDWTLDRWKIGVIIALFVVLVLASVARPPTNKGVQLPTEAELADAMAGDGSERATPNGVASTEGEGNRGLLVPGPGRPVDTLRLPLTLASFGPNAVVPPESVRHLVGTAAAGSSVKVLDQVVARGNSSDLSPGSAKDQLLGLASANEDGLWHLALAEPLQTGQHILTLQELGPQDELTGVSSPVVVTVLASGEEGPLALATPIIRSPALGTRLEPGLVEFTGTGLPGMVVRLYLNNNVVAESMVTTLEDWRIALEDELSPGVYTARVSALNPQGDVLAESAPLIFVVKEDPVQTALPLTLPAPTLPLTISSMAYGDRRRTTLFVNGLATPHAAVAAWLEGQPIKVVNAALDGHWLLALDNILGFENEIDLEVRSNFGERVRTDTQLQQPVLTMLPERPLLVSPRAGEVLTSRRPLLIGLAQPLTNVAILVNRQVVGEVTANPEGSWSYRMDEPLPNGAVALAAGWTADLLPDQLAAPIVVVVLPNNKLHSVQGTQRSTLSLAQKPPPKLNDSAPPDP